MENNYDPSLILTYGPYALVVFFSIIASRETGKFMKMETLTKLKTYTALTIVTVCWGITLASTVYVFMHWPPKTVIVGSLGTFDEGVEFYSNRGKIYISSSKERNRKQYWEFVAVADTNNPFCDANPLGFTMTIEKENGEEVSKDFDLPASVLEKGSIWFRQDDKDPLMLRYRQGKENDKYAPYPYCSIEKKREKGLFSFMDAYAEDRPRVDEELILDLSSSNRHYQANGRLQMRSIESGELKAFLKELENPLASGTSQPVTPVKSLADKLNEEKKAAVIKQIQRELESRSSVSK